MVGVALVIQFSACGRVERNPTNDDSAGFANQSPTTSSGGASLLPTDKPPATATNGGSPAKPHSGGGGTEDVGASVAAGEGGAGGVVSEGGAAGAVSEGGASACPLVNPAIAEPTCSGEGLIYEVPNLCVDDGGLSASDDLLEVYCCGSVKRFCLSGEECPWRAGCTNDTATCSHAGIPSGTDWVAVIHCCEWGGPRDFYCSEDGQVRDE
jgi:hypothetical protein